MNDLVTKDNSFYALYNEPFGDILKAYLIDGGAPAMIGMVADAPAPIDKEVTQIAKHVIQFTAQRIEVSGVKNNPKHIVSEALNDIDRQLKAKQLTNGLLCCTVIFIYDGYLYIGGVGDCTITLTNQRGALRFCHDSPNEPSPLGVEHFTVAPADWMGLSPDARLGDLPKPYTEEGVYALEADPTLIIYMFSDGLTKHIPDFYRELVGRRPEEVFEKVSNKIPKEPESLLDDICFTVLNMPPQVASQQVTESAMVNPFAVAPAVESQPDPAPEESKPKKKSKKRTVPTKEKKAKKEESSSIGFWILFVMLLVIMLEILLFGLMAIAEWETFKSEVLESLNNR